MLDLNFDRVWFIFWSYLTQTCYFFDHPRDLFTTCFIKVPTELEEHFNRSWLKFVNTTFQDSQQSLNIITSTSQAHSIDTFYYHFRRHYIHPPQEKLWIKKLPKPPGWEEQVWNKYSCFSLIFLTVIFYYLTNHDFWQENLINFNAEPFLIFSQRLMIKIEISYFLFSSNLTISQHISGCTETRKYKKKEGKF